MAAPPLPLASLSVPAELLDTLQTGFVHFGPIYAPHAPTELVDLAYLRFNPAAQQLLRLPAVPTATFRTLHPTETELFAFYRDVFLTGEARSYLRGTAGWQVRAQRHGEQLVVSLRAAPPLSTAQDTPAATDTSHYTLAHAQRVARQLTHEREVFRQILDRSPAALGLLRGPDYRFEYANPAFARLFGTTPLEGRPASQVLPQALHQGFIELLDRVYETGEPVWATEVPLPPPGPAGPARYFNLTYQAHLADGHADRLSVFAYEVTEQVVARQQAQQLSQELQAANQGLEARVAAGVQEARQAHAETEHQHARLAHFFEQAPAAICVLAGPELVFELVNPLYQAYFAAQPLLGVPVHNVPELQAAGVPALLHEVYATGITHTGHEVRLPLLTRPGDGQREDAYFDCTYQARYDGQNQVDGVLVFAYEVTEQVWARHLARQLTQELEARVTERTTQLQAAHAEVEGQRQQLQQLNEELEVRVAERTTQLQASLHEAELQRAQLGEQQSLLHQILGQLPAGVAVLTGPEHRFSFFNGPLQAVVDNRARLDRPLAELFPELVESGFVRRMDEVYATSQPFQGLRQPVWLHATQAHDSPPHYRDYLYQALRNAQGETLGVLAFIMDVTEQVLMQQRADDLQAKVQAAAVRQAQERETFYQIFAQTPAIVALMRGPEQRFEYVNPAFERLFPGRALVGRPVAEALPEIVSQGFLTLLDGVYQTGTAYFATEAPLIIAQPAGQPDQLLYLDITYQAYREGGHITGVSVFAFEVSEQVRARQQRKASLDYLQLVFEKAPVAIAVLTGPAYVVEVASPAICGMWGRDQAQVLGRPLFEVLPEVVDQGFAEILSEVHRTGIPFVAQEMPARLLRQGQLETVYFHFVYQPLANAQGLVEAVVVLATDVSQRVAARQQLAAANEELRATNQQLRHTNVDLDNFIYTASHDLKAPITNIESLLLLLRKELPPPARQAGLVPRVLDMMQSSIERFQLTIQQLTDLAHLQQAHAEPASAASLATVVQAVYLDLAPQLAATGGHLTLELGDCPSLPLQPQHLRSLVYNLLSNALKFHHPDRPPKVVLRCYREAATTVLAVQDNGLGLSETQQARLFGLYRRLHAHVHGSGVGLYMVKRLVENAGGTISVRSQPGVGSTFLVSLPD
ncbi:PAS domain-containing protein [Hymenobacter psoromatis]|uniref:PAS domain-containing protein n=1 Tax=Hymenobacter psoromatis TaxID=1484116 RepID=UPI001CBF1965|nr:PAS domain-containing protein [Hymenobacter psoromatis]